MRILSQTNDIKGYHGTIGTPTNLYLQNIRKFMVKIYAHQKKEVGRSER